MSLQYTDDKVLLDALRRNDLKAFAWLYNTSRNRLYVLALSVLNNEEASKDLIQDFFVDFWYHKIFANITTSVSAYLFQAVKNRSLTYIKKASVQQKLKNSFVIPELTDTRYPLENEELGNEINNAINGLPPMVGKVFKMQYVDNLAHRQIAEILGISKHTVNNHIVRALKELRVKLEKKL